jgi:hypothetical protein
MTLKVDDLIISVKLPDMRKDMPVFKVRGASLDERRPAIEVFRDSLDLGELAVAEFGDSLHFFSRVGEVQFYRPSGAIWARNAAADEAFDSEIRPWKTEETADPEDETIRKLVLPESLSQDLAGQSQAILEKAGLSSKHAFFAGVELEQIAELDEEGTQVGQFAGEATVRFLYKLEDVAVNGAGAKSYVYFNPGDKGPSTVGAFHAWRETVETTTVQMPPPEAALDVSLTKDAELNLYHERGHNIELTAVDLVYYTLPAFAFQDLVFPALRVVGWIYEQLDEGKEGFEFARFFHATPTEEYARSGLFADYLARPL